MQTIRCVKCFKNTVAFLGYEISTNIFGVVIAGFNFLLRMVTYLDSYLLASLNLLSLSNWDLFAIKHELIRKQHCSISFSCSHLSA